MSGEPASDRTHADWVARITRARRECLPGDLILLAEGAPSIALQVLAYLVAGDVLLERGNADFAREQFVKVLAIDPSNEHAQQTETIGQHGKNAGANEPMPGPRQVFLFSGHMADAADRKTPRFPRELHASAAQRIAEILDKNRAGAADLALTQGASGGDLIFLEACAARGLHLQLMQPLSESDFIAQSVLRAEEGESWKSRYMAIRRTLTAPPRTLPDTLGLSPQAQAETASNPFECCNRWLLNTALAYGIDKLQFICLWDGQGGDGPGGTAHMVQEIRRRSGKVYWIDTRQLESNAWQQAT